MVVSPLSWVVTGLPPHRPPRHRRIRPSGSRAGRRVSDTVRVMALRDKLRERVQPYLEPGEQVQQVFLAQAGMNPMVMPLLGGLIVLLATHPKIVAVTDR